MDNTNVSPPPIFEVESGKNNSFPVIAIAVIGILATAFLLISYYIFVIKCCLSWHRVDVFNRVREEDRVPTTSTGFKGLDEALIRSIPVIEFRKLKTNDVIPEKSAAYECAVCLNEFEQGERLRVIPNCCHAFHIDCIDIWLQSNANCPLCRSPISPSSIIYTNINTGQHVPGINSQHKDVGHDTNNDDDYVVIEIQGNNLDEPRLLTRESSQKKKKSTLRHVWSLGDEIIDIRKKDDQFQNIHPIRRSISMDLSSDTQFSVQIQQCSSRSNNVQENEVSGSSSNYTKLRRSIFSFGYGRSSTCSVHLDP